MQKRTILAVLSIVSSLGFSSNAMAQTTQHDHTHHAHEHNDMAHHHPHGPMASDEISMQAKLLTGQGEFIFSWDQDLTAAFPKDAHEFEPGMHGGFNEDPETGIVYTGIPGYGLCAISPDLKKWSTIGNDSRLKDNIHGIVFFVHKGKKYLAVAQEGKRVLVVTLDGRLVSEV